MRDLNLNDVWRQMHPQGRDYSFYLHFFTSTNRSSAPNIFMFWDTLNAFLRGQIIPYTKGLKKKKKTSLSLILWTDKFIHLRKCTQMPQLRAYSIQRIGESEIKIQHYKYWVKITIL